MENTETIAVKKFIKTVFTIIISIPIIFYGIGQLLKWWDKKHVKDEFYIEYLDSNNSICLWNGAQISLGKYQEHSGIMIP